MLDGFRNVRLSLFVDFTAEATAAPNIYDA
jgi:hypothetical protein